jgi:DNA-binding CsgD family transcriptional regulator
MPGFMAMTNRSLSSVSIPPARAASVVWDALLGDAAVQVAIVDADGVVRFANEAYARTIADREARSVIGQRLEDLMPGPIGAERAQMIRSVALGGRAVVVKSTWRGVRMRVSLRQLPARVEGKPAVLVVGRPEYPGEPNGGGTRVVQARHVDEGQLGALSPRERTVLGLIGAGMSTAQMARTLGRSPKTIENQRYSVARKLGARNRVELARIALRAGLSAPAQVPAGERVGRRRKA